MEPTLVSDVQNVSLTSPVTAIFVIAITYFLFGNWNIPKYTKDKLEYFTAGEQGKRKMMINRLKTLRKNGQVPPPFPNGWFAVLHSEDLKAGGATEVCALGLNLAAWRGKSGQVYISDAYCPHLGAHLGVGGVVADECIGCPFHGWQFRGCDGALTNIPYAKAEKVIGTINLKMHTVMEQSGLIYLWHHAEGEEPNYTPTENPLVKSGEWLCRGKSSFEIYAHIQDVCENGPDAQNMDKFKSSKGPPSKSWKDWLLTCEHVAENVVPDSFGKHTITMIMRTNYYLFGKFKILSALVNAVQDGPGQFTLDMDFGYFKLVVLYTLTPVGPLAQQVLQRWYCSSLLTTIIVKIKSLLLPPDAYKYIPLWNLKKNPQAPCVPKEESGIKAFRTWYDQYYSANSRAMTLKGDDYEW